MSLCRHVRCAVCEAISRLRPWAYAGIAGLPLFATGCGGVMHAANAELLALNELDEEALDSETSPFGDGPRQRYVPTLSAAENAPVEPSDTLEPQGDEARPLANRGSNENGEAGALAALGGIGTTADNAAPHTRSTAGTAKRNKPSARPTPTGPVSLFGGEPRIASKPPTRARRDRVTLTQAQEEVRPELPEDTDPHNFDAAETMTVDQIVNYAATRHPQLDTLREEIGVARAALVEASLFTNPQLTIDGDGPLQESDPVEMSTRIMFEIPTAWKRSRAMMAADAGVRTAQLAVERETQVVVDEAIAAAMEVVWLQELLELQGELQTLANELVNQVNSEVVPKSDQVNAKVNQSDVDLQRIKTSAALQTARMRLSKAMGLNPPRAIRVSGRLPDLPAPKISLDTLFAAVRENRPEIAEARAAIAQRRRELSVAQADAVPNIEVGPRFNDEFREPGDTLGFRIQTDLPIFNLNQGAIEEARANIAVDQANLRLTETTTLNDVAAAYAELEPMQVRLEYYRNRVPVLAAEAIEAIEGAFKTGEIDSNKMVNEQQRLGKLKIEHLNLRYQYNRLRARIELYAGRSLEQLAEIERQVQVEAERKAAESRLAPPAASTPEHVTPEGAKPKPPAKKTPATPGAKKPEVDSRVAHASRTGSRSNTSRISDPNVVPTSGAAPKTIVQKSPSVSPLEGVTNFFKRQPTKQEDLPYGNTKPATTPKR